MILKNFSRIGNFTSSEIIALTGMGTRKMTDSEKREWKIENPGSQKQNCEDPLSFSAKGETYISQCNFERQLGRTLDNDSNARPLVWGHLMEAYLFQLLPTSYKMCSSETIGHSHFDCWYGSPDLEKFEDVKTVGDIKCPFTLESFCKLVQPLYDGLTGIDAMNKVRDTHDDGEKFYWQLVSNGILTNSQYAELIVYVPYKSELENIRDTVRLLDGDVSSKMFFVANSPDEELPHLLDGGYYKDINIIRFEIPQADKNFLTSRVEVAAKRLTKFRTSLPKQTV